jgi:hypothetical protein
MFKFKTDTFIEYPIHSSAFLVLFGLLMFLPLIRPPVILSLILVCGLVYLSMFFGVKLSVPDSKKSG